ncbi:MAG: DsbE family thiol:disulfide interchange protein [Pseudomonadota bacterium]|nr:DsbE family thiol:disulfide interchange protein [Pseudomonadota bacterium]
MLRFLIPLALFAVLVVFLAIGLNRDPREVPSPLIDKAAPAFELPTLHDPAKTISRDRMLGKVWLLNVWASWCVACRAEHPLVNDLAKQGIVDIIGLNYKDEHADAEAWLSAFGDPFTVSAYDYEGEVGIDYGVYGVPETFVIDKAGMIRYKQIGPIDDKAMQEKIIPLIKELNKAS